jgi:hypothetical protein
MSLVIALIVATLVALVLVGLFRKSAVTRWLRDHVGAKIQSLGIETNCPTQSDDVVTIQNLLAETSFEELARQVHYPGERSMPADLVWAAGAKRLFDSVAVGTQAVDAATRMSLYFTEKGRKALE